MSSKKRPRRMTEPGDLPGIIGPPEPIQGEIVDDGLDDQVDEIKKGLTHIVAACRRGDGKRTSYWVGTVARQMAVMSKQVLRTTLIADAKEKEGSILTP